jgi:hypothetical protein
MHSNTHSVHNCFLKSWRSRLLCPRSSCYVFPPPLSGPNCCSLPLSGGPGPPTPKVASLFPGSAHAPSPWFRTPGSTQSLVELFPEWTVWQRVCDSEQKVCPSPQLDSKPDRSQILFMGGILLLWIKLEKNFSNKAGYCQFSKVNKSHRQQTVVSASYSYVISYRSEQEN